MTKTELLDRLCVLLGGRVAEETIFGKYPPARRTISVQATDIAKSMVKEYAMSERLGHMTFEPERKALFLETLPGASGARDYSEATAREIDGEVRSIMEDSYRKVKGILGREQDASREGGSFFF